MHTPSVQDLEASRVNAINGGEVEGSIPAVPEDKDDLSEYKFQKFAATYFQGSASHQYQRKPLKNSLLPLQTQGDTMVSISEMLFSLPTKIFVFYNGRTVPPVLVIHLPAKAQSWQVTGKSVL